MNVNKFQLLSIVIFLSFWYILFLLMRNLQKSGPEPHTEEVIKHLSDEVQVLKRLLDFENNELEGLKRRLEEHRLEKQKSLNPAEDRSWKEPIPILVFACNREAAVRNHLNKLIRYRPSKEKFPIIVTQDCDSEAVRKAVADFGDDVQYVKHLSGEKANITIPFNHQIYIAYYRIARHYKLALDHVFKEKGYTSVIITEDDLDIAPDFFEYFSATRYLLDNDPLLWCVSAWNDNGKKGNINLTDAERLYRSDFFSGLGWMMNSKLWQELGAIWPTGFWDDWMRDPARRKGRQCIRPEISRTGMTMDGKIGASKGQFFAKHLAKIIVNKESVQFTQMNLDYLLQSKYDPLFEEEVFQKAPLIPIDQVHTFTNILENKGVSIRVEYSGNVDYIQKADVLQIMHDFKAGVPRTAYKGVVSCFFNGVRVYLAPNRKIITGYDPTWEVPPRFGE